MRAGLITLFVIVYPYHSVRAILSMPFWPIPFCPSTILSIPFCPYHFFRYHFVLEPFSVLGGRNWQRTCSSLDIIFFNRFPLSSVVSVPGRYFILINFCCCH